MKLASIFSDGAIFQRRCQIAVWGSAQPRSVIFAQLNGQCAYALSSSDGQFMLRLPPMEAGGPFALTVTDRSDGQSITVNDVRIGEVWLASGQSNMEFRLNQSPDQCRQFAEMVRDPETLRMITIPRNASGAAQSSFKGQWLPATAGNSPNFSAVALWFAWKLREETGVPVGIIHSSWGGTCVETWTSRESAMECEYERELLLRKDHANTDPQTWDGLTTDILDRFTLGEAEFFEKFCKRDPGNRGVGMGWADLQFDDSAWKDMDVPGEWISQGLGGNGAAWFRREIDIPAEWAGKDLLVHTGGIDKHDVAYFNGEEIGRTGGGFETGWWNLPREYRVPARLVKAGARNVIAIRVYSFAYDGGFVGGESEYSIRPAGDDGSKLPLAGIWKASMEFDAGHIVSPWSESLAFTPGNPNVPSVLFDGMIRPLIPYGIHGAIWYQGEQNAETIKQALRYEEAMTNLIRDWRHHWGIGDFPFYIVQLAGFRDLKPYDGNCVWPALRESQRKAAQSVPNAAIAVAIDVGEEQDIHPKDKRVVGFRLAALALRHAEHREDVEGDGPLFESSSIEDGAIRICFRHARGLHARDGEQLRGFYIAGEDGSFHPGTATIDGSTVVVRAADVRHPLAVRYSWADFPDGNLYNAAGLPASPFRTDSWPLR